MKSPLKQLASLAVIVLSILIFTGCKKDDDDDIVRIQSVVPQPVLDDLRSRGMLINEGTKPPTLNDAYVISPYKLKSQYGPGDNYEEGRVITDYLYKFYEQNDKNEIKYDYYNLSKSDTGAGTGAFIAGDGQKFTIFSADEGTSGNIPYKTVTVISGELSGNGIKNFQYAFVITEKTGDDNNSILIPVGKGRIWTDGDLLSEPTDKFRRSAEVAPVRENTTSGSAASIR